MTEPKEIKVNIVFKPIAAAIDGHNVRVSDNGQAEITFFQMIQKTNDGTIEAQGVSSVRMTMEQLIQLKDVLNKVEQDLKAKGEK